MLPAGQSLARSASGRLQWARPPIVEVSLHESTSHQTHAGALPLPALLAAPSRESARGAAQELDDGTPPRNLDREAALAPSLLGQIHLAARQGRWHVVEAWLQEGQGVDADVDALEEGHEQTLLMTASAEAPDDAVVAKLLQRGANVSQQDRFGNTPLHLASQRGSPAIVKRLLAAGCNPILRNDLGKTAAEGSDDVEVLKIFRDHAIAEVSQLRQQLQQAEARAAAAEALWQRASGSTQQCSCQ